MQKDSELFLFVGSYADATDPGINLFRFDVEKGTAVPVKSLSGIQDPSYLTVSRDGKFVYSVSETAVPDAKVCAYSFDKQTGTFSLLNEQHNRVEMNHLTDGIVQLSAGLTFKLGKTDFEVLEPMDYALLNDLNGQINALRAENDELSKRPVSCPECEEVVTNVVNNYVDNVVYFRINSAKIDKNQQVSIFNTAQFMKENNVPIKVIGYADKKTGTGSYNMQLSEKRARAVAKELIDKYGISSSQITIEWKGSDVQPYNENNWNRVVIMSANN